MNIKVKLENWIKETLNLGEAVLVHPADFENGDFSLILNEGNIEENLQKLQEKKIEQIEKIELANGRFINFYLSKEFFAESAQEIIKEGENSSKNDLFKGQKTIIEFTDPNPFKEFHIGHLMSNTVGESISRIIEAGKAEVKKVNYQGDVGLHVAKAIWGKIQKPDLNWGGAYAYGAQNYEQNKEEIIEINKKIYEETDEKINKLYQEGKVSSLEEFENIYKRLGTKFDFYFFESQVGEFGKEVVLEFLKKGVFEESDGAIVFRGEKRDSKLHTRVFLNSQGIPVYEAKELGLSKVKYDKYPYDKSIIITGNEIDEYFKVLLTAMKEVFPDLAAKTLHLSHGMMRLSTGKMSSRTGDVITAESLIEQVREKVLEKIKDREFSDSEKAEIAEIVAIGAIKYSILRQSVGGDIIFDFDKSISFEGDSGPYLQYTAVRANSVLEKAGNFTEVKPHGEITYLERTLYRFPEVVERAGKEYSPHYLVTYLTELAGTFNSFYAQNKIIDPENPEISTYRLALTKSVSIVLTNGLHLLGIKVPERM